MSYLSTNVHFVVASPWLVCLVNANSSSSLIFHCSATFSAAQVSDIINATSWVNQASCDHDPPARTKTSKYFGSKAEKDSDVEMADASAGKSTDKSAAKRKLQKCNNEVKEDSKPLPAKKMSKDEEDDDDDFVAPPKKKTTVKPLPSKKAKVESNAQVDDAEDEDRMDEDAKTPSKGAGRGRGRGGRGGAGAAPGGRGRGGGGGRGFMNFGERKDPPHKGEKVTLISLSNF